jgi:hypothetical protein
MRSKATILSLMGVVAVIAIARAALRNSNEACSCLVLVLTLLLLCTATVVAIYLRAAWAGFAVFGWAMFLICQPNSIPESGRTPLIMNAVYEAAVLINTAINPPTPSLNGPYDVLTIDNLRVALCLTSLAFGCFGAIIGEFIARYLRESNVGDRTDHC